MSVAAIIVTAVWAMLPAYFPNNVAVVTGGGRPIDNWSSWNGHRVLGDGKTWRGTIFGILAGTTLALILNWINPTITTLSGFSLPYFTPIAMVSLPTGALLGDISASFVKRRIGRKRGSPLPIVDQLDFVIGAFVLTVITTYSWFITIFTPPVILAVVIITPVLHVGTNLIGYVLGFKQEPW